MRDFKNIKAWKHADDLAVAVYSKTKIFPKEEMYGLTSLVTEVSKTLYGLISAVKKEA